MKKLLALTFFSIALAIAKANDSGSHRLHTAWSLAVITDTLPSDSLQAYLSTIDLTAYYGHPVDFFLNTIPNKMIYQKIGPCSHDQKGTTRACILYLRYHPQLFVEIWVKDFTHMDPYSSTHTWNETLFRQEKIHKIRVWKKDNCVNGECF